MKIGLISKYLVLLSMAVISWSLPAQDNITIPKSRLEELERKEKELERLKNPAPDAKPNPGNAQPTAPAALPAPVKVNTPAPPVQRDIPPLTTLPPFTEGQTIDALDLADYYRQDPAAANQRFKNRKMVVRGEIAAFEKPLLVRDYRILLDGGDRDTKVVCEMYSPQRFKSVFTANHGKQLVGLQEETRVPMAEVLQVILITGKCKGFKDGQVMISGLEFTRANETSKSN